MSFWDDMVNSFGTSGKSTAINKALAKTAKTEVVSESFTSGDKVTLIRSLRAALEHKNLPKPGATGTVIKVRVASGVHTTQTAKGVYVKWDDGVVRPIQAQYLKRSETPKAYKAAYAFAVDARDAMPVFSATAQDNELVHRATKQLWAATEIDGKVQIERLFDDGGHPIKCG